MSPPVPPSAAVNIFQAILADSGDLAPEISTDQMRVSLDQASALIVDSRIRAQFDAGHIPGAVCLDVPPQNQVTAVRTIVGGDLSRPLVVYCNGPHCQQSRRLSAELMAAGFTSVSRYQLGISVWRVLGGPTAVEISWVERVLDHDDTAVLMDARSAQEYSNGSLPRARSSPVDDIAAGRAAVSGLPHDDFNRRVILFGRDPRQARVLAEILRQRPWANVSYVESSFAELSKALSRSDS
jgi:rhodanese-related sulfurtransferase